MTKTIVKVGLKVRINDKWTDRLVKAGIKILTRDQIQDAVLRQKQAAEAQKLGKDPMRFGRTDATGQARPDSGECPFNENQVKIDTVLDDVKALGVKLVNVYLMHKEGDVAGSARSGRSKRSGPRMTFLCLWYQDNGDTVELTGSAKEVVDTILAKDFGHVQVWVNPDRSMTINAAHFLVEGEYDASAVKTLNILDLVG